MAFTWLPRDDFVAQPKHLDNLHQNRISVNHFLIFFEVFLLQFCNIPYYWAMRTGASSSDSHEKRPEETFRAFMPVYAAPPQA